MTIAVGQSVYTTGTYTGTPITSTSVNTSASGSSFIVFCIGPASVTYTPTDSKSNTYVLQGTQQNNTSDNISLAAYLCTNGTGGTGHTFSLAMSVHAGLEFYAVEVTGGATTSILDQFFGNTGILGNPTPGPVTTTNANDLILSCFKNNGTTATSLTPAAGFTPVITTLSAGDVVVQQVVSSTGTYDPSVTFAPSGGRTQIITLALKAAGSGSFTLTASNGAYSITGENVAFSNTATGTFTILVGAGNYAYVGGQSSSAFQLNAFSGAYTLTGESATLVAPQSVITMLASGGVYSLTGVAAILSVFNPIVVVTPQCITNFEIITDAYQLIGVIDENSSPSNEQGVTALSVLNDYLLNEAADGMRLGWFRQSVLQACAPLRDEDVYGVKILLALQLAARYGVTIQNQQLLESGVTAKTQLVKRSLRYSESDFSEFPRPQGGPWGGPNWI